MNIPVEEFWDLSLSEYDVKSEGYFLRQDRGWDKARWIGQFLYAQLSGKDIDPRKLLKLEIDEDLFAEVDEKKKEVITKQDVIDFEKKWLHVNTD